MKKFLSLALVLVMALSTLAGCGSEPAPDAEPAGSEAAGSQTTGSEPAKAGGEIEEGAKLVYWPMWSETEPQGSTLAEAIEAFTEETGVEVEINFQGGRDTRKTLQPALDAGETIDIFDEDIERVNITWKDYLLDIQDMYDASPLAGNQNANLIKVAQELGGGKLHSVPYQPSTFVVMYNKDAFDKAGIKAVPTTWDEFMAACEALKGAGVIPMTTDDAYMAAFFGYMMDRVAGFETTKAVAAGDFGNEAVLKTAQVIEDMVKKGYIDPRASGNSWPNGQGNVADESVAMYLNGTWLPNEIRNQTKEGFRWGSFALPNIAEGGDGAESNNFGAQCFAINKDTKYPNAAFALVQWLTSGEWDQKLADNTLGVPMDNNAKWPEPLVEAKGCIDNTTQRLSWAVDMENDANVNAAIKTNLANLIGGKLDAAGFAAEFAKISKS